MATTFNAVPARDWARHGLFPALPPSSRMVMGAVVAFAGLAGVELLAVLASRPALSGHAGGSARAVACLSGLVALGLLGLAMGIGITVRLGGLPALRLGRPTLTRVHLSVAALAVVVTVIHLVGVFAVPRLGVGWLQLLVPGTRMHGRLAQAVGVVAVYLLAAIVVTSALRRRMPWRLWHRVHLLSTPMFVLAVAHTLLAECWGKPLATPATAATATLLAAVPLLRAPAPQRPTAQRPSTQRPSTQRPSAQRPSAQRASTLAARVTPSAPTLSLVISQLTWEADDVMSLRLTDPRHAALPAWTPGSHLEVQLPSGRLRYYSIYGDPADRGCYRIAVLRQDTGRGGSREVHDALRLGQRLPVSTPRNTFPLRQASSYLFIAGGIGITAVLPMARVVANRGVPWWLIYIGKSRNRMALAGQAVALAPRRVLIVPADLSGRPHLPRAIAGLPPGAAVYCCGPNGMLDELDAAVGRRPDVSLHLERFGGPSSGRAIGAAEDSPVELRLHRSGQAVRAAPAQSLLDAVRGLAPQLTGGCEQGVCGRCRVTVLDGEPDHHDTLLSPAERGRRQMLLCVSRARTPHLTLDL